MKTNLLLHSAKRLTASTWMRRGVCMAALLPLGFGAQAQNLSAKVVSKQAAPATPLRADILVPGQVLPGQPSARGSASLRVGSVAVAQAQLATAWTTEPSLSQVRGQHAAVAANGRIYAWGGYLNGGSGGAVASLLSSMEIYTIATKTWVSGPAYPIAARGQAAAASADGYLYSFGGAAPNTSSDSYRYNPAGTGAWSAVATMPVGEWEAAATAANGLIYVTGGYSSDGRLADTRTQIYSPGTNTWTAGAAMPTGRHGHVAVLDANGLLHVLGGVNNGAAPLTAHEVYNPTTDTWTTAAPLPMALNQAGATLGADGNIYVVGGKASYINNEGPFYKSVYSYTPGTNTWSQGPDLPTLLSETKTVSAGPSIYTLAGSNGTQQSVLYQLAVGLPALTDTNPAANTVVQNAAVGTAAGITASTTDPNGQAITYSLLNNAGGRFAINATTGVVSVAAGAQFPTAPITYTITVQASNGTATTSQDFAIDVTVPVSNIAVQYQTGDLGQPTDGQVRPFLQLVNSGTTAVPYSQLTVRYWLTVENFMGQLVTPIDYAKLGTSFVSARYVQLATPRQGALGYIEYAFSAAAGNLNPGTNSGPIYGKAYKPDYTNLDETDDWSYQTSSSFTENSHVTVYQNGTLVNGTEPAAVTATTALQVYSASRDAATSTQYLSLQLQVRNTGNLPVNYGDVKVRYYFTRDGATSVVPQVDYAKLGNNNVSLRVVNLAAPVSGADAYLEVTFSAALGVFYPRTSTDDILVKLRKDNYQAFDQTNDYTFSGSTMLTANPRFPAYVSNQLVFGTPPAGTPAIIAAPTNEASATATSPAEASIVAAAGSSRELTFTGSPNPFGEQLRVQFALPTAQAYTLAVYDGQGRLVQQLASGQAEAGQAQELAVPTQGYAAGLYLVRLTTATGVQHLKLIKQ
ncbi:MAG: cellulose binding domain-containing protein [Janthinobacterium lividum]